MLRARRRRAPRALGAAREHALAYDADRVLTEHWLPALEQVAARLPGLAPPFRTREDASERAVAGEPGTRGSSIAPICVPLLMMSRKGCASVISWRTT